MKRRIAIFLSGTGTNALAICAYFKDHPAIEVAQLLTNKENSGATSIGNLYNVPVLTFDRQIFYHTPTIPDFLQDRQIEFIILAGFLWLIPGDLLRSYPNKILNIHPALLPKYGGKGMHGRHVHELVWKNKEQESGITIHLCNEKYDEGKILFQEKVQLSAADTPESIAKKVQSLEYQYFPKVIEEYIMTH